MITTLLEISTTKVWMMHPPVLNAVREMIQSNIAGRITLSAEQIQKRTAYCVGMTADGNKIQMSDLDESVTINDTELDVQNFVTVIPVCGPITREGDACSYGSIDFRNDVMEAASQEECAGIVVYINSYGGSSSAINDYKYAVDYAHKKGKKIIAFVDGACCSAAQYLAVLCDETYFMNEKDTFGSIGVMAAFYTLADGEKNRYTNETYHELYAEQSYEKNKWHRDAADGNYDEVKTDLNTLADEFVADVKAHRPNVKDEHLHGATFDAKDIVDILADGQSTLEECIDRLVNAHASQSSVSVSATATNTNTFINMSNYPLINAACGMNEDELKTTEEGAFMNAPLLDALEAHLSENKQQVADAEQKATTAEQALAEMQGKMDNISAQLTAANEAKEVAEKALADAQEAHSKEIETLTAQHTEAVAKKDEEIASLTSAKTTAEEELKGAKEALAGAEQRLADKDAQIAELTNEPAEEQAHGEAPANNGEGAKVQTLREFDPSPYKTNAERKAAFERFKRGE